MRYEFSSRSERALALDCWRAVAMCGRASVVGISTNLIKEGASKKKCDAGFEADLIVLTCVCSNRRWISSRPFFHIENREQASLSSGLRPHVKLEDMT